MQDYTHDHIMYVDAILVSRCTYRFKFPFCHVQLTTLATPFCARTIEMPLILSYSDLHTQHVDVIARPEQKRSTSISNKPSLHELTQPLKKDMLRVETSLPAEYRPVAVSPDPEHQMVYLQRSDVAKAVPEIIVPAGFHPMAFDDVTCLTYDSGDIYADGRQSRSPSEERLRLEYNAWLEQKKGTTGKSSAKEIDVNTVRAISPISLGTGPTPTASSSLAIAVLKSGGAFKVADNRTVTSDRSRANSAYMSPDEDEDEDDGEDYSNVDSYVVTDENPDKVKGYHSRRASTSSTIDTTPTVEGTESTSVSSVRAMREALEMKARQGNSSIDLNLDTFYMKQRKTVMEDKRRKSESRDTLHSYRGNFQVSEEEEAHLSAEEKDAGSRSLFRGSSSAFRPTLTNSDDDSHRERQFMLYHNQAKLEERSERSRVSVFPHDYTAVDCLAERDASIVSSSESFFNELRRKQKLQKEANNPFKKLMCCLAPWMMNEKEVANTFGDDDDGDCDDNMFVTRQDCSYSVIA